jgi:transcriptional regulator with XRE-family HTH domain
MTMKPEEVKAARTSLKCTIKEFASVLELEPSTITAWERGEEFPTKKYVSQIEALVAQGPNAIPKKAKGVDPLEALRDPDVWALFRKLISHPKLRTEVMKLAAKYDE